MSKMVRKQIYISKRQEQLLKRLSQARGVSKAEIIRNAIDQEIYGGTAHQGFSGAPPSALEDFIRQAQSERGLTGEPTRWQRSELYIGRENRGTHQVSERMKMTLPLVDTNILIYASDPRDPARQVRAIQLLEVHNTLQAPTLLWCLLNFVVANRAPVVL